ncbi:MAG TPA: response regulator, partial [Bryobacteraceae bacterium]|nr:response regulator [Bryobacteraceae bacterium]
MRSQPLVLNVDDDLAGRYAVGRTLKQSGYDVRDAGTGEEALRLAAALRPDVILLDIRLPDIDGFEVCRRIRQNPELVGTVIIQMSASYLDSGSQVKGLETGADASLTEPVEPPILIATIRSMLRVRQAEQTIRRSALEWQITFDAIRDGVALLDAAGSVLRSNKAFEEIAGPALRHVDEAIGGGLAELRSGAARHTEEVAVDSRFLLLTLDPVRAENALEGAVCVLSDITEKKRFETELRQTAKLESIGVLAGGIAHDFNNLLTGIIGNSGLLLETVPEGTTERELVDEIMRAGESAADLTRQILAYAGKARFLTSPVNLSTSVLESRTFLRRFISGRVELICDTAPDLPVIEADPSQIQQLIMNLVINAAESFAESKRGVVIVKTSVERLDRSFFRDIEEPAPGVYAVLTVTDTGSGMDETTQHKIFEPFFTTKFAGRGLGLSAVHGIIRSHRGYLRLESIVGEGTTFRVYFPVAPVEQQRPAVAGRSLPEKTRGTVLFVDDESVIRNFARLALRKRGCDVLLAENGQTAVDVFRTAQNAIDLIVLDFA